MLLSVVMFACKKNGTQPEQPAQPDLKKYNVTLSIADFAQSVGTQSVANNKTTLAVGDTLSNYAQALLYRIYDASGTQVAGKDQLATDASFGQITEQLPAGSYNVCVAVSKRATLTTLPGLSFAQSLFSTGTPWADCFFKVVPVTVSNAAVNQQVRLDRAVGGLEVTLEDAIPSGVSKISLSFQQEVSVIPFNAELGSGSVPSTESFTIAASDVGQKNKKFSMYVANTKSAITLNITAYDASNKVIATKAVPNVTCIRNKKTLLSGSLFPAVPSASTFTVVVNPTWDASAPAVNF